MNTNKQTTTTGPVLMPGTYIPQAMLQGALDLREDKNAAERAYKGAREQIINLHHQGLLVEPGRLTLRVNTTWQRRLTRDSLRKVINDEGLVQWILGQIEPVVSERLDIKVEKRLW